ncbi:molybdenum cofactor biosynthesis protein B [Candidatus Cyanaurora vandensis]|uniref:MogA/MoaB family molybdenum cofactor biosynthesis protein n=1 Tax=Candidatus Cyanaurora vandensis TaxID=2714958 RepID=UPI002579EFAE|nr:molybdenum cofactor biosynthesis protein B [Candidatus Cyanaurora vandensis]
MPEFVACAVLTLSDTRTQAEDVSGQIIQQLLQQAGHQIIAYQVIPDESAQLADWLDRWRVQPTIQAILITGGTGVSPRDITPEVLQTRLTKPLPGFGELFRLLSWEQVGTKALASRALAGMMETTVVFALPGSTKAVTLAMERLILPELVHLVRLGSGAGH